MPLTICHILEIKWVDAKLILILNVFFEKENITQDAANSEIHFKREICEKFDKLYNEYEFIRFFFVVIKGAKPVT